MTNQQQRVGGIDSHKDSIHIAVISQVGQPIADREFPTTVAGYRRAVAWLIGHGPITAVGVEGTSSYGVGITTQLLTAGIAVVEVNRTRPAEKRRQGKTDPLDAYRAARSVLSGEATTDPKSPTVEPLRALTVARRSAVKAQQAARRQINALLVNTQPALRDRFRDLSEAKLLAVLHDCRPEQIRDVDVADTMYALRTLARRERALRQEILDLEHRMQRRATHANPALMSIKGIGPAIGPTADHRRRQPRPAALLRLLRRSVWHRPDPGRLGQDQSTPALPWRGPTSQRRPTPHRQGPHVLRPDNPRLPRRSPSQGLDHQSRVPGSQTSRRP